jgi:hypothetical protein
MEEECHGHPGPDRKKMDEGLATDLYHRRNPTICLPMELDQPGTIGGAPRRDHMALQGGWEVFLAPTMKCSSTDPMLIMNGKESGKPRHKTSANSSFDSSFKISYGRQLQDVIRQDVDQWQRAWRGSEPEKHPDLAIERIYYV